MPGAEAGLAEQRRLLVAGDAGDRNRRAEQLAGRSSPNALARRPAPRAASRAACRAASSSSSSQSPVWMLKSSVREALRRVGDVRRAAGDRFQMQPGVDGAERELAALGARRARRGRCRAASELGAGEIRRRAPGRSCCGSSVSTPARLQRVADARGAPVLPDDGVVDAARRSARSQTIVVSRWLVMPMAATSARPTPRLAPAPRARTPSCDCARSRRVVLDPAGLRDRSGGTRAARSRRTRPSSSKTIARELVVPWSSARMYFMFADRRLGF